MICSSIFFISSRFNAILISYVSLAANAIDLEGELPDHLAPVLRYLGHAAGLLPELIDVLPKAIQRMLDVLGSADPGNPYLNLLEATSLACKDLKKEAA